MDDLAREIYIQQFHKEFAEISKKFINMMRGLNRTDQSICQEYYNSIERYISNLELDNMELHRKYHEANENFRETDKNLHRLAGRMSPTDFKKLGLMCWP